MSFKAISKDIHTIAKAIEGLNNRIAKLEGNANGALEFLTQPKAEPKKAKPKAKAKAKPKAQPVVIEGHPTRETWTKEMYDASRKAYNEASGTYSERNIVGLLAAKAVA